ncbi:MAG TPA: hypothetical protein PLU72_17875 [Candidatus Ozemobacteraceae bacterium]|nr:hypothetical protein [Candidatus Ozemobacteraceae bacterium]HQG28506.1 hypothetical protein [Candidatus Ozemobacteraceae bacterium]
MMWTAIQLLTCVTIVLAIAFFVGKRIGQRRFIKMQEEMKALEKAFNQLLEQMELVSGHNLQVLDNKTQELRELLNVADKKCLYATDLMKEVDEMKRRLQNQNRTAEVSASPPAVSEIKLRREVQDQLDAANGRIESIDAHIRKLEQEQEELFQQILSLKKCSMSMERAIQERPAAAWPCHAAGDVAAATGCAADSDGDVPDQSPRPVEIPHVEVPPAPENPTLDPSSVITRIRHRDRPALANLDPMQTEIINQVLDLCDQGVSIPQIARQMKMSKTEIELMLKFYDMRKAV